MITFERAKEIFSDRDVFEVRKSDTGDKSYLIAKVRHETKDGFHYEFSFRLRPNGFNDCAQINFSRWTRLDAQVLCFDICQEDFIYKLLDVVRNS